MSRRHAQIRRGDDGCFQLICLGANHVLVDGQLLKAGEPPLELSHGNRLVVGSSVLLFQAIAAVPDLGADRQRQGANKVERWLQDTWVRNFYVKRCAFQPWFISRGYQV
jgi:hypothetical protein